MGAVLALGSGHRTIVPPASRMRSITCGSFETTIDLQSSAASAGRLHRRIAGVGPDTVEHAVEHERAAAAEHGARPVGGERRLECPRERLGRTAARGPPIRAGLELVISASSSAARRCCSASCAFERLDLRELDARSAAARRAAPVRRAPRPLRRVARHRPRVGLGRAGPPSAPRASATRAAARCGSTAATSEPAGVGHRVVADRARRRSRARRRARAAARRDRHGGRASVRRSVDEVAAGLAAEHRARVIAQQPARASRARRGSAGCATRRARSYAALATTSSSCGGCRARSSRRVSPVLSAIRNIAYESIPASDKAFCSAATAAS